jgi:hypothetical protein
MNRWVSEAKERTSSFGIYGLLAKKYRELQVPTIVFGGDGI